MQHGKIYDNITELIGNTPMVRLRKVLKAKPQKKIAQTDAIFENLKKRRASDCHRERQTLEHRL